MYNIYTRVREINFNNFAPYGLTLVVLLCLNDNYSFRIITVKYQLDECENEKFTLVYIYIFNCKMSVE